MVKARKTTTGRHLESALLKLSAIGLETVTLVCDTDHEYVISMARNSPKFYRFFKRLDDAKEDVTVFIGTDQDKFDLFSRLQRDGFEMMKSQAPGVAPVNGSGELNSRAIKDVVRRLKDGHNMSEIARSYGVSVVRIRGIRDDFAADKDMPKGHRRQTVSSKVQKEIKRLRKNMTIDKVAKKLKISKSTVSRYSS